MPSPAQNPSVTPLSSQTKISALWSDSQNVSGLGCCLIFLVHFLMIPSYSKALEQVGFQEASSSLLSQRIHLGGFLCLTEVLSDPPLSIFLMGRLPLLSIPCVSVHIYLHVWNCSPEPQCSVHNRSLSLVLNLLWQRNYDFYL